MKRITTLSYFFCLLFSLSAWAAPIDALHTFEVTSAGSLKELVEGKQYQIINLKLTGVIDARDFVVMRDKLPLLSVIDLSDVTIAEYKGTAGTWNDFRGDWIIPNDYDYCEYAANAIPRDAFVQMKDNSIRKYYVGKKSLRKVILPTKLTKIEEKAFYLCKEIEHYEISPFAPNFLTEDGILYTKDKKIIVLHPAAKTDSFTVPQTVESIDTYAFNNCNFSLLKFESHTPPLYTGSTEFSAALVQVPEGCIESYSMFASHRLIDKWIETSIHINEPGTLADAIINTGHHPATINKLTVSGTLNDSDFSALTSMKVLYSLDLSATTNTEIPNDAFLGKQTLCEIILPQSLETIGDRAFYNCGNLTGEITLPKSVCTIGSSSFQNTKINGIELPSSLTIIGEQVFKDTYLRSIDMSKCANINEIPNSMFENCTKLSSATLPPSLKVIGDNAFYISNLSQINFPNTVTNIGPTAFYSCPIGEIQLPSSLISIGGSVFSDVKCLTTVDFSKCTRLESIGNAAFYCSASLEEVDLSPCVSLKTIGDNVFSSNVHRGVVSQPAPDVVISGLKKIILPASLEKLGSAFYDCIKLQQINLGDCNKLKSIASYTFAHCQELQHITLPVSLTDIDRAFWECTSLASVTSKNMVPPTAVNTFDELDISNITLNIPNGTKSSYMFAPTWKDFVLVNEVGYSVKALIKFTDPIGLGAIPGSVSGSDLYEENAEVTLIATPFEHYKFIEWTDEENNSLSTQTTYSFKAHKNQTIYAVFDVDEENPIIPDIVMQTIKKAGEEIRMSIVTTSQNKTVAIDWGNGIPQTYTLGDYQQFNYNQRIALVKSVTPVNSATIKIYGDNIDRLFVSGASTYADMHLSSLELNHCPNLTYLYCGNNQLTKLDISNCPNIIKLYCSGNNLGFSSFSKKLSEVSGKSAQIYSIPTELNINEPLDLSNELYTSDGTSPTKYTWHDVNTDVELTSNVEYKENNGVFTFLVPCYVYCVMTNPDVPGVEIYANYMRVVRDKSVDMHVLSIQSPTTVYTNKETTIECVVRNNGEENIIIDVYMAAVPDTADKEGIDIETYKIASKELVIYPSHDAKFTTTLPNGFPNAGRYRMYVYTLYNGVKVLSESSPQYITVNEKLSYDKEDASYDFSLSRIILRQKESNKYTTNRNSSSCFLTHLDIINNAFSGLISYGLLQNDNLVEIIGTGTLTNLYGYGGAGLDIWCKIPASTPTGEYDLVLLSKREEDEKYKLVDNQTAIYNIRVQLTDTEVTYIFPDKAAADMSVLSITTPTTAYVNTETVIECELRNKGEGDLATEFHVAAVPEANDIKGIDLETYKIASKIMVVYPTHDAKFTATLPNGFPNAGRYRMYVYTLYNGVKVLPESSPQYITVNEKPSYPIITLESDFIIYEEEYQKRFHERIKFDLRLKTTHSDTFTIGFFARKKEEPSTEYLLLERDIQIDADYTTSCIGHAGSTEAFLNMETGDYTMFIKYLIDGEWITVEPGSLNAADFRLIPSRTPIPFVSAPFIINDGQDIQQGGNGIIKATIKCADNYTGGIFVETEGVLVGPDTHVDLQANVEQTIELIYSVYINAPLGEHTLLIKFTDREGTYSPVIIDGFEDSARFTVVLPTGIDNPQKENGTTVLVTPDGFLVKGIKEEQLVRVLDLMGNTIHQAIVNGNEIQIPMTHNAKGIYLILIVDEQNIETIKALW
ncbi:leucine-rich repeat protein [Bacteroides sp. OttesenSCG-928-E20]|nr:leucine-rich repeat protein [Bacteroides sp. OttesenSCG-928-E20]MDL2304439.1 leucine-rich repeat protein [Bacteroides sp. OttesenSCG-928-D19]